MLPSVLNAAGKHPIVAATINANPRALGGSKQKQSTLGLYTPHCRRSNFCVASGRRIEFSAGAGPDHLTVKAALTVEATDKEVLHELQALLLPVLMAPQSTGVLES